METDLPTKKKRKRRMGCVVAWVIVLAFGLVGLYQLQFVIDPGLRDLPIRSRIRTLTAKDCAVLVDGCQKLYREHSAGLSESDYVRISTIPEPASRVGYESAVVLHDLVRFQAGAGAFSQVGPILITCWMDPATKKAKFLTLDDGRIFDPAKGDFGWPGESP